MSQQAARPKQPPKTTRPSPPKQRTSTGASTTKPKVTNPKPEQENKKEKKEESNSEPASPEVDDEAFARQLQQQLSQELEDQDAAFARQLHQEEQDRAQSLAFPARTGIAGRPQSATPLRQLFTNLFNMRVMQQELEDEDDNTTPAMEPDTALPPSLRRPQPSPYGRVEAPSGVVEEENEDTEAGVKDDATRTAETGGTVRPSLRPTPGLGGGRIRPLAPPRLSPGSGLEPSVGADGGIDPLPGVRLNPAGNRYRGPRPGRRIIVTHQDNQNSQAAQRPTSALVRPAMFDREDTFTNLPEGELDPDFMVLDLGENERQREANFINIMRDPFLLMMMLMGRHPGLMVPDDVDLNDYESLWELAERLGDVRNRGMTENDIKKLPCRKYNSIGNSGEDSCSICLSEFKTGCDLVKLPCKHDFHKDCVTEWLKTNGSCPVCRHDVKGDKS
ncbi:uncharacterized protein LOC128224650 [Mya arenaria]|uniref:uncharacterized protein LOC128224650 n=1 Tax=Mya arenaria TaxID=6604 RepID=UPI0022E6E675|nr:uncharacterized protein LOC128224650 [Mya arenaria]XP_052790537.1 uncharacterized protein LOC128224650 [Mya arenaria]XP_052790538.1 uncharacterized protein LOC128224650 [Mya arenaria]